jgi:hypothetical protein
MQLSQDELAEAEKAVARMEKSAKMWKFERWFMLVVAIGFMAWGSYFYTVVLKWEMGQGVSLLVTSTTAPSEVALFLRSVLDIVDARVLGLFVSFVNFALGMWLLGNVLSKWRNRGIRYKLFSKMARQIGRAHV